MPLPLSKLAAASTSCFRLLVHWARRAASRADWTAGSSRAISTAMIAMTTSSSISVNPLRRRNMGGSRVRRMWGVGSERLQVPDETDSARSMNRLQA